MQESVRGIKTIRLTAAVVGLLAGFGVSYLANFFLDSAQNISGFYPVLIIYLPPVIVLGIIVSILWIRKPLSAPDAESFVIWCWIPFFLLYLVISWLYWASRV